MFSVLHVRVSGEQGRRESVTAAGLRTHTVARTRFVLHVVRQPFHGEGGPFKSTEKRDPCGQTMDLYGAKVEQRQYLVTMVSYRNGEFLRQTRYLETNVSR